jgi:hypothetical protein
MMFMLMLMTFLTMALMWSEVNFYSTVQNQAQLSWALDNGAPMATTNSSSKATNDNAGRGAFHQFLATFDWSKPWTGSEEDEWQRLFLGFTEFNYQEPQVAIDSTCSPPALLTPDRLDYMIGKKLDQISHQKYGDR